MSDSDGFKDIPESLFADDDGSADARLAQALIRYSRGRGPLVDVVDALAYARVLIPVMASGEARHVGKHGLEQDEVASTGVVAVQMPDGRTALPVFTDVDAMQAWNAQARPIPAEGPRAALAAVAEEWSNLVVNPGMESALIPRPAVWALGQGQTWQPAVVDDVVVAPVVEAITQAVPRDEQIRDVSAAPGRGAEVAVVLRLVAGLTQDDVNALVRRVQAALAASEVIAQRVDSVEIRLAQAG
ncbi:MAG: SseB family protein [Demequina sp.]